MLCTSEGLIKLIDDGSYIFLGLEVGHVQRLMGIKKKDKRRKNVKKKLCSAKKINEPHNKPYCVLDLKIVWYIGVLDHKIPLQFEFLRLSRQLLCHMIWGKLLRSYVRDGEHPCVILNGCVCHNGT